MTTPYKASLESARRLFTLIVFTLSNDTVKKASASQILTLIKTAKVSSAAELGEVVRRAIADMSDQVHAKGMNIDHAHGIIQRIRREGHI